MPLLSNMLSYHVTPYPTSFGIAGDGFDLTINEEAPSIDTVTGAYATMYIKSNSDLDFSFLTADASIGPSITADWTLESTDKNESVTGWQGETIDYGPCAFMDSFNPDKVFSSIDQMGRYRWSAQPDMAAWNLTQLAGALLPVIDADEQAAIEQARSVLDGFPQKYEAAWLDNMRAKIGLRRKEEGDGALINGILSRMASARADFTLTFKALSEGSAAEQLQEEGAWESWERDWRARLARENGDMSAIMRAANPVLIPRNHRVEEAIEAAVTGDFAPFHRLNTALSAPFEDRPEFADLASAPSRDERVLQTFCGT